MVRKLKDLNLIDDFLINRLVADPTYGKEFSQILLRILLQREMGELTVTTQKVFYGSDTDRHGIRLDVYVDEKGKGIIDVEADKNNDDFSVTMLPKRARFYHSKIDADTLKSGGDYEGLKDVVVIFITNYDPLGADRMLYTVRRKCEEEPELPFEDGSTTLFFYTRGKNGKVTSEVRQLLEYIECSDVPHAKTDDLKKIQKMVEHVKQDSEAGKAYMKFEELMYYRERRGIEKGSELKLITLVCKKAQKGKSLAQIASELEEDVMEIQPIYDVVVSGESDYDPEAVWEKLNHVEKA